MSAREDPHEIYKRKFWGLIEREISYPVPTHIKKIFEFTDYDIHPVLLAKQESGFNVLELEDFIRSDGYKNDIPADCIPGKLDIYYGSSIYRQQNPSEFKWTDGESELIKLILKVAWDPELSDRWERIGDDLIHNLKVQEAEQSLNGAEETILIADDEKKKIIEQLTSVKTTASTLEDVRRELPLHLVDIVGNSPKTIEAKIKCPKCDHITSLKKKLDPTIKSHQKGKWNIFNVRRHLETHSQIKEQKKAKKTIILHKKKNNKKAEAKKKRTAKKLGKKNERQQNDKENARNNDLENIEDIRDITGNDDSGDSVQENERDEEKDLPFDRF